MASLPFTTQCYDPVRFNTAALNRWDLMYDVQRLTLSIHWVTAAEKLDCQKVMPQALSQPCLDTGVAFSERVPEATRQP